MSNPRRVDISVSIEGELAFVMVGDIATIPMTAPMCEQLAEIMSNSAIHLHRASRTLEPFQYQFASSGFGRTLIEFGMVMKLVDLDLEGLKQFSRDIDQEIMRVENEIDGGGADQ